jgi:hypothetical protein
MFDDSYDRSCNFYETYVKVLHSDLLRTDFSFPVLHYLFIKLCFAVQIAENLNILIRARILLIKAAHHIFLIH